MSRLAAHWLLGLNVVVGVFVAGALLAPAVAMSGAQSAADALYAAYHLTCHQWAFRSFFLFGDQATYSIEQLQRMGVDPFAFVGQTGTGWKMAICERDIAIYVSALVAGVVFAARRGASPLSMKVYALLILPMALDGFSQLIGWRESTWQLRVLTGVLFGAASVWMLYPRFDAALSLQRYAPENACVAQPRQG
jgi:uncharacterized membrane protein